MQKPAGYPTEELFEKPETLESIVAEEKLKSNSLVQGLFPGAIERAKDLTHLKAAVEDRLLGGDTNGAFQLLLENDPGKAFRNAGIWGLEVAEREALVTQANEFDSFLETSDIDHLIHQKYLEIDPYSNANRGIRKGSSSVDTMFKFLREYEHIKNGSLAPDISQAKELIQSFNEGVTTEAARVQTAKELFELGYALYATKDENLNYYATEARKALILNEIFMPTLIFVEENAEKIGGKQKAATLVYDCCLSVTKFPDRGAVADFEALTSIRNIVGPDSLEYFGQMFQQIEQNKETLISLYESGDYQLGEEELEDVLLDHHYEAIDRGNLQNGVWDTYFDGHAHILHNEVLRLIASEPWKEEEKPQVVKFLGESIGLRSFGAVKEYAELFESLDVKRSYPVLLENLKSESVLKRRMSAEVLYRLEMGKIGITGKEGVRYFDKLYRLVREGDPDFFVRLYRGKNAYVRRIDSQGSIGAFDGMGRLLGCFKLDLTAEEDVVEAVVNEVNSKDVFLPKADETPAERHIRESFLELFLASYGHIFEDLDRDTGIKLSSLDLHEQGWFVSYYSQATREERDILKGFISRYGELGLKVFLALDYGGSVEEILRYTENPSVDEKDRIKVFSHFYKIANMSMEWRRVFEKAEEGTDHKFSSQVHEALIRKTSEYFRAALLIERGQGGEVSSKDLLESMSAVSRTLEILRGLYIEDSSLKLEGKPQIQAECADPACTTLIEDARITWILSDKNSGSRVVVSVRSQPTVKVGSRPGGEARINFKVTDKKGFETRIGVDLSHYGEASSKSVVSLDLGTGVLASQAQVLRDAKVYPSQNVGRVLDLVAGSEGGHNEASFGPEIAEHFTDLAHRFADYMRSRYEPE